jgi:hypothetical protein
MKRFIYSLTMVAILIACSEESSNNDETITVTYEVISENGVHWYGEFTDENGERINTIDLKEFFFETEGHRMPSGWKYSFQPKKQPIILTIAATADCPSCDHITQREPSTSITANIYINDQLVWTETDGCRECTTGIIKGLATSWFKYPEEWQSGN